MKKWINLGVCLPLLLVSTTALAQHTQFFYSDREATPSTGPTSTAPTSTSPIGNNTYLLPPSNIQPAPPLPPSSSVGEYASQRLQQAQQQAEEQALLREQAEQGVPSALPPGMIGSMPPVGPTASMPAPVKRPPSPDEASRVARERWSSDPSQALRQSGGKLEHPLHRGFFFSPLPQDQELLHNWVHALKNEGVTEEKVVFEAQRLNKEEFVRWASRLVWFEQEMHPNIIDVYP